MRDVNVNRLDANVVAALRSCILEMINKTQKPGSPPNAEDIFDAVCGFYSGQVPVETDDEGLALLSFVEAVVETETGHLFTDETGHLFTERYFKQRPEEQAMKVKSSMHKGVEWVSPDTPVRVLANIMREQDIGAIPIGENDRLIGMVTDRDVTVRAVANGTDTSALTARDVMTKGIVWCGDNDDVSHAANVMQSNHIRRLPVIDKNKRMVGILSLGDLSHTATERTTAAVTKAVSAHHD
jgi:CBS domain-containing protein